MAAVGTWARNRETSNREWLRVRSGYMGAKPRAARFRGGTNEDIADMVGACAREVLRQKGGGLTWKKFGKK